MKTFVFGRHVRKHVLERRDQSRRSCSVARQRLAGVSHAVASGYLRLIQTWLAAGVLEDGKRTQSEMGTVQGGSISPLLSNVYLHYVFDLWIQRWRRKQARGDVVVVRWADDFVVGFSIEKKRSNF